MTENEKRAREIVKDLDRDEVTTCEHTRFLLQTCPECAARSIVAALDAAGCEWCRKGDVPHLLDKDGVSSSLSKEPGTWCHSLNEYWWPCASVQAIAAAEARGRNQALQSEQHRTSYNIAFEEGRAEGERVGRVKGFNEGVRFAAENVEGCEIDGDPAPCKKLGKAIRALQRKP